MKPDPGNLNDHLSGDDPSPLKGPALAELVEQFGQGWEVVHQHHLERSFRFPDFRSALDFTNRIGRLAEEQQHHPDIHLAWGEVRVQIHTHKIDALSAADFILAARISAAAKNLESAT